MKHLGMTNNLKYIKDHIGLCVRFQIFFQLMVTVFKENINLKLLLIFHSIIRFVFETVFQNNLRRTGVAPSYRLVTYLSPSLMFLTIYMILQFRVKQFGKFQNHIVWIWKQWLGSFALKIIFRTTRVRDETFRNGKRYEDKV